MVIKVVTIVGARPQFIKAAPVSRALRERGGIEEFLVHTGQHFNDEMSDVFFRELQIPKPAVNLAVHETSHARMTAKMLIGIEDILRREKPQGVLVYGDTNSTLAGALAAAKLSVPIHHVEAGLRSFNFVQPEEINRKLTDHLSRTLFCPTQGAVENLMLEGIVEGVEHVGDVMFDLALIATRSGRGAAILERLGLTPRRYRVATLHRAENVDVPTRFATLMEYLRGRSFGDHIVVPLHPRTRAAAARFGIALDAFRITEPLGYFEMSYLVRNACEIFTDSGGLQKEAYFNGVACVTLRDETEWPETIAAGWNRLWTVPDYMPRRSISDYGDGRAAHKIAALLRNSH